MTSADPHTLTGAYALNALPPDEGEEFERHLGACPPCAQEVIELTATAERLGSAVSTAAPPEMKGRVLAHIATVRQLPPQVRHRARPGGAAAIRRSRRLPRFVLAACLAAAAALGGIAVWQHQDAEQARRDAQRVAREYGTLAQVLAAPDARSVTGRITHGATGTVVVSHSMNKAGFFTSGLPNLPSGKTYQLWFSDGGKMRSAGLMGDGPSTAVLMEGAVGHAVGMGITVEPAGGSPQPTAEPLALMELPHA